MATETIRYVNPNSAGGDGTTQALSGSTAAYASLNQALGSQFAAIGDLVSNDLQLTIECAGGVADTVRINRNDAWTTSATCYLLIRAAASDRASAVWSESKYRYSNSLGTGSGYALSLGTINYLRIDGLQFENTHATNAGGGIILNAQNAANDIRVSGCYIRSPNMVAGLSGLNYSQIGASGTKAFYAVNNVVEGFTTGLNPADRSTNVCYNNTLVNCATGISATSTVGTCYFINNLFTGCTTAIGDGASGDTCDTNATDLSSLGSGLPSGTGNRVSQTFTFAGTGDYRLASGDAGAKGFGSNLSADSRYPFNTEMDGTARPSTWDIGADQVTTASSGGSATGAYYYRRRRR